MFVGGSVTCGQSVAGGRLSEELSRSKRLEAEDERRPVEEPTSLASVLQLTLSTSDSKTFTLKNLRMSQLGSFLFIIWPISVG